MIENSSSVAPLEFRRRYAASLAAVYAAWTEPERIKRWLHPSPEWVNPFVEVDLRVGGRYRIGFLHPESNESAVVGGEYLEIVRERRLLYTWTWEPPHEYEGVETVISVEFNACEGGTDVHLTQRQFSTDAMRELHCGGWGGALDCLGLIDDEERV